MTLTNEEHVPVNAVERKIIVISRLYEPYGKPVVTHCEFMPVFEELGPATEDEYAMAVLTKIKDDFCKRFVEFTKAIWTWHVFTVPELVPTVSVKSGQEVNEGNYFTLPDKLVPGTGNQLPKKGLVLVCFHKTVDVTALSRYIEKLIQAIERSNSTYDIVRNPDILMGHHRETMYETRQVGEAMRETRQKAFDNGQLAFQLKVVNDPSELTYWETFADVSFYVTNGVSGLLIQRGKFRHPIPHPADTALVI